MKTVFAILSLSLLAMIQTSAMNIPLEDEPYVDDIPFNTHGIYIHEAIPPHAEANVTDFPFNTADIAARELIPIEEEANVDDIPFSTAGIAFMNKGCCLPMDEEASVDDIPFETSDIVARERIPMDEEREVFDFTCEQRIPMGNIDLSDPVLEAQAILFDMQGMFSDIGEISRRLLATEHPDHDTFILELDRVVSEGMNSIFKGKGLDRIF